MAHEPFDPVLTTVAGVTHAGANDRLKIEREPLLGAAGHVMQMKSNRPKKLPGAPAVLRLGLRQHITHIGNDVEWLPGPAAGVSLAVDDVSLSGV